MPVQLDPEEAEPRYLHDFAALSGARVLEVGCGNGRMTWRYAASAGFVTGIDPVADHVATALRECPPALRPKLVFAQARAESLPFPRQSFDLAIMSWTL